MADFKTKLFGLAGIATAFAGMAFGQATCTTASANAVFIRSEGKTEQVADTTITCSVPATNTAVTAGQTASITVYLSPAVNVTSYNTGTSSSPKSEAIAGYNATATTFGGTPINGTVSGNSVTFTGIVLPAIAVGASQNLTITNIKVDASSVASGTGVPTGIAETIFMSGTGIVPNVISPQTTVAYVTNGLGTVKASGATSNPICNATNTFSSTGVANAANWTISVAEGFADAFKVQGSAAGNTTLGSEFTAHTETGYGVTNTTANTATSGTRVKIVFGNIPANVAIYVPLTVSNAGGTLTLTTSETGAFTAATAATGNGDPGSTSNSNNTGAGGTASLAVSSGSATAIYEATAASTTGVANYAIPVYLKASAGAVGAPSAAITATVSLAPIGAASNVPNFVSNASTATVNGSTFSACATTLLFPFVTNQLGFDTGIAISNTSSDLLAKGGTASAAAKQNGTCTLNFFGDTAPSAAVTTATINAGSSYAAAASTLAPGFQGYMIANCNFLYGHGFAYVVYNLTQNNGAAMGYLADAITSDRKSLSASGNIVAGAGVVGTSAVASTTPEQ